MYYMYYKCVMCIISNVNCGGLLSIGILWYSFGLPSPIHQRLLYVLYLFLIFLGYSFKLRWMFHKLYGSGNHTVCQHNMLHVHFGK